MQTRICRECGCEMNRYSYINAGDYSKELFKTISTGEVYFNVTQWKFICPSCKYGEIVLISPSDLKEIESIEKNEND